MKNEKRDYVQMGKEEQKKMQMKKRNRFLKTIFFGIGLYTSTSMMQKASATDQKLPWKSKNQVVLLSERGKVSLLWSQFSPEKNQSTLYMLALDEQGQAKGNPEEANFFREKIPGEITLLKVAENTSPRGAFSRWIVAVAVDEKHREANPHPIGKQDPVGIKIAKNHDNKQNGKPTMTLYRIHEVQWLTRVLSQSSTEINMNLENPKLELTALSDGGMLLVAPGLGHYCVEKIRKGANREVFRICKEPVGLYVDAQNQEHLLGSVDINADGSPLSVEKPIDLGDGCALFGGVFWFGSVHHFDQVLCYHPGKKVPSFVLPWKYTNFDGMNPRRIWTGSQLITLISKEEIKSSFWGLGKTIESEWSVHIDSPNAANQVKERQNPTFHKVTKITESFSRDGNLAINQPVLHIFYEGGEIKVGYETSKEAFPHEIWGPNQTLFSLDENGNVQKRRYLANRQQFAKETISWNKILAKKANH